jgi:hypothetical protein
MSAPRFATTSSSSGRAGNPHCRDQARARPGRTPGGSADARKRFSTSSISRLTLCCQLARAHDGDQAPTSSSTFEELRATNDAARLLLVGDGPLQPALEQRAKDLGVFDACRFVGFRADVGSIYAVSDAVALTSANEGTPVTMIEAQAAGLPVVSTDVGGVRDVIPPEAADFVVPPGDARLRIVSQACGRSRLRRRLGGLGRAHDGALLGAAAPRRHRPLAATAGVARVPATRQPSPPARRGIPRKSSSRLPQQPHASHRARVAVLPPEVGAPSRMQSFAEYLTNAAHVAVIAGSNHPQGAWPGTGARSSRTTGEPLSDPPGLGEDQRREDADDVCRSTCRSWHGYRGGTVRGTPRRHLRDHAATPSRAAGRECRMLGAPRARRARSRPAAATSLLQISPGWDERELLERRLLISAPRKL